MWRQTGRSATSRHAPKFGARSQRSQARPEETLDARRRDVYLPPREVAASEWGSGKLTDWDGRVLTDRTDREGTECAQSQERVSMQQLPTALARWASTSGRSGRRLNE